MLAVFAAVYLGSAFSPALLDDADATHAEAAREMAAGGDFVTLRVNGIRYLEKAPLMYWLVALSYRLFGTNEFATRLPLMLATLLTMALAYGWARRAFGARAAVYAALFVSTAVGFYLFTRILIPEALLSLFLGGALYFFLTALEEQRPQAWRWYAGYVAAALAVLTKGLVALVIVGPTAAAYLALSGDWRRWREFRLLSGLALLIAVAAPWHLLAGLRNQGFFWFYFVNEHFLRFLGRRYPKDYNKLPALVYWSMHLLWIFPWSLYLPGLLRDPRGAHAFRRNPQPLDFAARTRLLCWIWAGLILMFFAFSTNQEYYTFPVYLPLLLLVAGSLAREEESASPPRWLTAAHAVFALIGISAAAVLGAGLWSSRHLPFVPDIGTVLVQRGVGDYTLSMSAFFDLTAESFAALRLPAALAAAALSLGPLVALGLRLRRRHYAATWAVGITAAIFLVAAHLALVRFEPHLSSRQLARAIAARATPADRVMIYGDQAFGSSLLFYLERPIYLVNGRSTSMEFGSKFPDAPRIFLDDAALDRAWAGPERVFLFVPVGNRARAESTLPQPRFLIAESSGKVVYSNRP